MTMLEWNARIQAGTAQVDFRKALAWLGRALLTVLVFVVSLVPFSVAWLVTMVVKLSVAAAREGVRTASGQLGGG